MPALYLITALATALMAGFFWSFSVVVMDGLRLLPPLEGMRAMQSINSVVRNALFGLGFLGTPLLCALVLLSLVLPGARTTGGVVAALGAALYLALGLAVTFTKNVPLNEALDAATGAEQWQAFLPPWVFWNHVRTLGSLTAACLLGLGYALAHHAGEVQSHSLVGRVFFMAPGPSTAAPPRTSQVVHPEKSLTSSALGAGSQLCTMAASRRSRLDHSNSPPPRVWGGPIATAWAARDFAAHTSRRRCWQLAPAGVAQALPGAGAPAGRPQRVLGDRRQAEVHPTPSF